MLPLGESEWAGDVRPRDALLRAHRATQYTSGVTGLRMTAAVCTFNRADLLPTCLEALAQQHLAPHEYEILIVDNGSTDDTPGVARQFVARCPNARLVREQTAGLSHARNAALREARGDYVAFIDDDARACPRWLECILQDFLTVEPRPAAVGGPVEPWYAAPPPAWLPPARDVFSMGEAACFLPAATGGWGFVGCNMAFDRRAALECGGFSPQFGYVGNRLRYGEDAEFSRRLYALRPFFWYDPRARVAHWVSADRLRLTWRLRSAFGKGVATSRIMESTIDKGIALLRARLRRTTAPASSQELSAGHAVQPESPRATANGLQRCYLQLERLAVVAGRLAGARWR